MHFCGTESYTTQKIIVISCITIYGMHITMILFSKRFDFGNFQNFSLHSFLCTGFLPNQRVSSQFAKILIINLISLNSFPLT